MIQTEIVTLIFTGVIAATSIIGACIFYKQLSVMQGQLEEMRSAGKHTETIAAATKEAADAAKQAANIAERSLIAAHRPWIKAEVTDVSIHVPPSAPAFLMNLEIKFRNIGRSPAKRIRIHAELLTRPGPQPDIPSAQIEICERHRADKIEKGFFLFPEEERIETTSQAGIPNQSVAQMPASIGGMTAVVCLAYDSDISDKTHVTSFVLSARPATGNLDLTVGRRFTMSELRLERHFPREIAD